MPGITNIKPEPWEHIWGLILLLIVLYLIFR